MGSNSPLLALVAHHAWPHILCHQPCWDHLPLSHRRKGTLSCLLQAEITILRGAFSSLLLGEQAWTGQKGGSEGGRGARKLRRLTKTRRGQPTTEARHRPKEAWRASQPRQTALLSLCESDLGWREREHRGRGPCTRPNGVRAQHLIGSSKPVLSDS